MRGPLTVTVTVSQKRIENLILASSEDSAGIIERAVEGVRAQVLENQTLNVDTVTGATVSCGAILKAARDAISQAGAGPSDFSQPLGTAKPVSLRDEEYDVVVVGSGLTGLSAAMKLGAGGVKVLVLEKLAYTGGSSRHAGGGILSTGSRINRTLGQDCTLDEFISFYEQRSGKQLNRPLLEEIYKVSGPTFDYFVERGIPVDLASPRPGHPDTKLPVFFAYINKNTPYETGYGGKQIADFMLLLAVQNGAEVRTNANVVSLIVENGSVMGVEVESPAGKYKVWAKNTILATGGFTQNPEMVERYAPEYAGTFPFTGAGSHGDGITMTENLDTVITGEGMMGLVGFNPNIGYYGEYGSLSSVFLASVSDYTAQVTAPNLFVNKRGESLEMRDIYYSALLPFVYKQPGKIVYGITSASDAAASRLEAGVARGVAVKAGSASDLAVTFGIDAGALNAEVARQNLTPPLYGVPMRPLFIGSIPGLVVGRHCEVLNSRGAVIPNLYAGGELIFGNLFDKLYPASGTGLGFAAYTGVVAAEHILESFR
jgi:fumarate reductase flavoprotein subunit